MTETTKVGKHTIEIRNFRFLSIVTFRKGAHGKEERGDFAFWTAKFKRVRHGKRRVICRAWVVRDAGERFRRICEEMRSAKEPEDRAVYGRLWAAMGGGANIAYIRPSTVKEIKLWMCGHKADAVGVIRSSVGGKLVRIK